MQEVHDVARGLEMELCSVSTVGYSQVMFVFLALKFWHCWLLGFYTPGLTAPKLCDQTLNPDHFVCAACLVLGTNGQYQYLQLLLPLLLNPLLFLLLLLLLQLLLLPMHMLVLISRNDTTTIVTSATATATKTIAPLLSPPLLLSVVHKSFRLQPLF